MFSVKPLSKFKSAFAVLNSRLAVSKGGAFGRCPQAVLILVKVACDFYGRLASVVCTYLCEPLRSAPLFFRFLFSSPVREEKKEQANGLRGKSNRDIILGNRQGATDGEEFGI
ncbi:MAG: hypothetical protein J6I45_07315 [Clostridia bacterium]|nr:hypothetical protein [Clostridia bacterium]